MSYWSFLPTELNLLTFRCGQDITDLLVQAHRSLGILEGMMRYIPNVENFLEMMIYKDSRYSCRIDEIDAPYRDIVMGNDGLAGVKSALNCCKVFHGLPDGFFTEKWICSLQETIMDGIISWSKRHYCITSLKQYIYLIVEMDGQDGCYQWHYL